MADASLTERKSVPAKSRRLVYGAQHGDESHNDSQANAAGGGPAHDWTGPLNKASGSSTAQQAQRSTGTAPGIPEASGHPAFMPAVRKGSTVQAWVPRRRNWASFDALDDLPDLSGHRQPETGKPSRDSSATRQPDLADCQPSERCSEALRPLKSSLSNVAPVSRDDRPEHGTAQSGSGLANTAASPAQRRLQCDGSPRSAPQFPCRLAQRGISDPAKPESPSGAFTGAKLPQCTTQASDTPNCNAHAVPCASIEACALVGQGHHLQLATAAASVGPCRKPFAAPRLVGKAREGDSSSAGEDAAHAAQGSGSQGRPSALQQAAEGDKRQQNLARTACQGRSEAQHFRSSSVQEQQALDAEASKNAMQRDASCAVNCSTDQEPVISDSWADSASSEHNEGSHLQELCSEQQVSRAAQQHMLLSQETHEQNSRDGGHRQQGASPGRVAQESAKVGASGMGLAAQEGGSGQLTTRKRLKRLYNAPSSLNAHADSGSGHSTEVCRIRHAQCSILQGLPCTHDLVPRLIHMRSGSTLSEPLLRQKEPDLQRVYDWPIDDVLACLSSPDSLRCDLVAFCTGRGCRLAGTS